MGGRRRRRRHRVHGPGRGVRARRLRPADRGDDGVGTAAHLDDLARRLERHGARPPGGRKWFDARRGLAVALVCGGIGLGVFTVATLARALTTLYGWRVAMLLLGDLAWLVILPLALLIREQPGEVGVAVREARD